MAATAITIGDLQHASAFDNLTRAQQLRIRKIWQDAADPGGYVYLMNGGQVVGRADVKSLFGSKSPQIDYGPRQSPRPKPIRRRAAARSRRRSSYTMAEAIRDLMVLGILVVVLVSAGH